MKKLIIILLSIVIIYPVSATTLEANDFQSSSWSIEVTPFYLKPVIGSHVSVYGQSVNMNGNTIILKDREVNADYNPGFSVNLGYQWFNTTNGINLEYTRLHTNDSDKFTGPAVTSLATGSTSDDPIPGTINGTLKIKLDQADLTVRHGIDLFEHFNLLLRGGLRFARIDRIFDFGIQAANSPFSSNATENDDFIGIGPIAGIDGTYFIFKNFGLSGTFNAALLVGNVSNKITFLTPENTIIFKTGADHSVQPILETKLGANYSFQLSKTLGMKIEAGYKIANYFDFAQAHHSLNLYGPYVTLTLCGLRGL